MRNKDNKYCVTNVSLYEDHGPPNRPDTVFRDYQDRKGQMTDDVLYQKIQRQQRISVPLNRREFELEH